MFGIIPNALCSDCNAGLEASGADSRVRTGKLFRIFFAFFRVEFRLNRDRNYENSVLLFVKATSAFDGILSITQHVIFAMSSALLPSNLLIEFIRAEA
jgi:hypothetical protein